MKKINIISILLIGLIMTGCSGKKAIVEEEEVFPESSDSSSIESSSYDNEGFYEPRDTKNSHFIDENKTAVEKKDLDKGKVEVVKTSNGNFKIELPDGWQTVEAKALSDNADVSLENKLAEAYYMVLSEGKKEFENFDSFKTSIDLSDLGERKDEKKEAIEYNGLKGERRTFTATKDDVAVYYIYDLMEGKDHYLQCISWTLKEKQESNEKELKQLMNSLAELEK